MTRWQPAPLIKVYEALGALGDNRIELNGNEAKIYSSSGNKYYHVAYDPDKHAITANDNGSYYIGYLGYPSIAFLLAKGLVDFDPQLPGYLKGFAWKDINQKFKNDFAKTQTYIDDEIQSGFGIHIESFHAKLERLQKRINDLRLQKLASNEKPPDGY